MHAKFTLPFFLLLLVNQLPGQTFSVADSLRGGLRPERTWWDLNHYNLHVEVSPEKRRLDGTNTVSFTALETGRVIQIDLQPPMRLKSATFRGVNLLIERQEAAHFLQLPYPLRAGERGAVELSFGGAPRVARNPPWDGGLVWAEDPDGKPWIANANQGIGSSVWWPCKDHPADEVDSMRIAITAPAGLTSVGNGRLVETTEEEKRRTYVWEVSNPINDYGVNLSVGDYASWTETFAGESGPLQMSYYVLRDNEARAREHFTDARRTVEAFEHWFGPYPFYEDGFKLIEVPYLGMEHQSAVAYGNKFLPGYLGTDLSGTGEGMKFDFIIVHEVGHEWFANNITNADVADMWIHESFTAYSESLFLDYHYGPQSAEKYVVGTRRLIKNDRPIESPHRGVAHEGSGDMYYKGANILHTLRRIIADDEKWRAILRGLNRDFYHQTVTSRQIYDYLAARVTTEHFAPEPFFVTYNQSTRIPKFTYRLDGRKLTYRWTNVAEGFKMPLEISLPGGDELRLNVTTENQTIKLPKKRTNFLVDAGFYVELDPAR